MEQNKGNKNAVKNMEKGTFSGNKFHFASSTRPYTILICINCDKYIDRTDGTAQKTECNIMKTHRKHGNRPVAIILVLVA